MASTREVTDNGMCRCRRWLKREVVEVHGGSRPLAGNDFETETVGARS